MDLKDLKADDLTIAVARENETLQLNFQGAVHSARPEEFLAPYFEKAVAAARTEGLALVCDFTGLEYMNSASIPPLIQLLRNLAEEEVSGEFVYDASRKVQTASFRALDVIARKSRFTAVRGA